MYAKESFCKAKPDIFIDTYLYVIVGEISVESHCRRKCTRGMEFKVICGAIIFASLFSLYFPLEKLCKIL